MVNPYFVSFRYNCYLQKVNKIKYEINFLQENCSNKKNQKVINKLRAKFSTQNDNAIYQVFAYQQYARYWKGWVKSHFPGTKG